MIIQINDNSLYDIIISCSCTDKRTTRVKKGEHNYYAWLVSVVDHLCKNCIRKSLNNFESNIQCIQDSFL